MKKGDFLYQQYLNILSEELRPAMGCTEPIAMAYAAAKARQTLGCIPDKIRLFVSGNIIKNVKSVVVPNTGGLHGMAAAISAGIIAGDADKELEVISSVPVEKHAEIRAYMQKVTMEIQPAYSDLVFDIDLFVYGGDDMVRLRIANHHTNVVLIQKNEEVILETDVTASSEENLTDKSCLNIEDIVDFANTVDVEDIRPYIARQVEYNMSIAESGITEDWGANIGKVMLHHQGTSPAKKASAWAAAGSDARMSGCEKPVIICSGSGNQGITASVPVVVYARELGIPEEKMLRAVALSDLVTLYQKVGIGRLSAYCGAISAGCGAGAAIAYLQGGDAHAVAHVVVNAVAILSGTICDGAKPSCAAKIAAAVDAGILGYQMYLDGQQFYGGDGIVTKGVDNTVRNVGILAREGMRQTDRTILEIMLQNG